MRKKVMKQLQRQSRIRKDSLVVGLDVGKEKHSAALCLPNGELLRMLKKVFNSRKGFQYLLGNINHVSKQHNLTRVIIGFEPTGPYWQPIAHFLEGFGFDLAFVRPGSVAQLNKLSEGSNSKTDQQDALKIASLLRHGHFLDGPVISDETYKQMRTLSNHRGRVREDLVSSLNRLGSTLQVYFPELAGLFSSLGRKSLLALLDHHPLPQDLLAAGPEAISNIIKKASHNNLGEKKAKAIYLAAQSSIGLRAGPEAARFKIRLLVEAIRFHQGQKQLLEKELIGLAKRTPHLQALISLPGLGPLSAALFLAALGDPARFTNAREIVSYAGMDPIERQSGLKVSPSFSSKQGRHDLRHILYLIALRCIKFYEPLRSFYQRKSLCMNSRTKKKALCAASNKLVHVLFAIIRDGSENYQNKLDENKIRHAA